MLAAGAGLQVVWLKRDLRDQDHAPLARAAALGPVVALYVFEPEFWRDPGQFHPSHFPFVVASLRELRERLRSRGADLWIRTGAMLPVLQTLHLETGFRGLWAHQETGLLATYHRDIAVARWARNLGIRFTELPSGGVVRRLGSRDGWAQRWEHRMRAPLQQPPDWFPYPIPVDEALAGTPPCPQELGCGPDPRVPQTPVPQTGGQAAAHHTLQTFLTARGQDYRRQMSNPVDGWSACSRISPYLAWGNLSVRQTWQAAQARLDLLAAQPATAAVRQWRDSIRSFVSRLHWHCHFIQKLEDEPALEARNLHPGYDGLREAHFDAARYAAWQAGQTGVPMVDACMRALRQTGWLNFRMRAMLVSFASYHLWLHWREPARWMGPLFLDFEPGIHLAQFQMQSGVTGINTVRIYNPVKQALDQDPQGVFLRRWLPELQDVPTAYLAAPWTMPPLTQLEVGCRVGVHYPTPIVDLKAAAAAARETMWGQRNNLAFAKAAREVWERHGSRAPAHRRR